MILTRLGAFGIGYVLGTRAGRERYEQILVVAKQAARRLEEYGSGGSLASRPDTASGSAAASPRRRQSTR